MALPTAAMTPKRVSVTRFEARSQLIRKRGFESDMKLAEIVSELSS